MKYFIFCLLLCMASSVYPRPSPHSTRAPAWFTSTQDGSTFSKVTQADENGVSISTTAATVIDGQVSTLVRHSSIYMTDVSLGLVAGHVLELFFGFAADVETGDGFVDLWDGNGSTTNTNNLTYSTTDDIDSLSSSSVSDTETISIRGLDVNYDQVTQSVVLSGQTRVALATPLLRVLSMVNIGTSDLIGEVYCYVNGAITLGVPNDTTDIRAIILGSNNQTLMSHYTVANGKKLHVYQLEVALTNKGDAASDVKSLARPFGGVFITTGVSGLTSTGTSRFVARADFPIIINAKTDFRFQADTDANNLGVSISVLAVLVDD